MKDGKIGIKFDPKGFWVGLAWQTWTSKKCYATGRVRTSKHTDLILCVVPMFPIRISWDRDVSWKAPTATPRGPLQ